MIQRISILCIFSSFGITYAMQKDLLPIKDPSTLIKQLLSQPVDFTMQEKVFLQTIATTHTSASMWQLGRMKGQVDMIVGEKIMSAKSKDCEQDLKDIEIGLQKALTWRICKKIDSCCLATWLLMITGLGIYSTAIVIHEMQ